MMFTIFGWDVTILITRAPFTYRGWFCCRDEVFGCWKARGHFAMLRQPTVRQLKDAIDMELLRAATHLDGELKQVYKVSR